MRSGKDRDVWQVFTAIVAAGMERCPTGRESRLHGGHAVIAAVQVTDGHGQECNAQEAA